MNSFSVLFVGNSTELKYSLSLLQEDRQCSAALVHNGEDAVAMMLLERIDLVIIEMDLPGINGNDVYHALLHLNPGLDAILITTNNEHLNINASEIVEKILTYKTKSSSVINPDCPGKEVDTYKIAS